MAKRRKKSKISGSGKSVGIFLVLIALLLLVSLATHDKIDDDRITGTIDTHLSPFELSYQNQGGLVGAYLAYFATTLFGWLSYFIPVWILLTALNWLSARPYVNIRRTLQYAFIVPLLSTMIYNVYILTIRSLAMPPEAAGGWTARYLTVFSLKLLGELGSYIVLGGLILAMIMSHSKLSALLSIRLPRLRLAAILGLLKSIAVGTYRIFTLSWVKTIFRRDRNEIDEIQSEADDSSFHTEAERRPADFYEEPEEASIEDKPSSSQRDRLTVKRAPEKITLSSVDYVYPPLELLQKGSSDGSRPSRDELLFTARILRDTLETFGVKVDGDIQSFPGPVITRFEFKPAAGVKVNQIVNLSDDLALALKARRIRILAPIPGKAAIGLEIPNRNAQTVYLKDIISTSTYSQSETRLPLALGMTTSGKPFVADLAKMPHLLIAGATGSGKSICMNVLITSLLYRLHPLQVRFIFIDPKMLELSIYSGIPFLARPVVTKPKQAERVLSDAVVEMEGRYKKLAEIGTRNIEDFNRRQERDEDKLPYIVIFVDELADLMMASTSSRTELLITRLAQMSRAVGIHLILATQRPSVDVITGLIKANFPARIAFQVSSKVDSRTIMDANGAEKLLGKGDMLFLAAGQPEPIRIHGAFISSAETEAIVNHIKDQNVQTTGLDTISQGDEQSNTQAIDFGDPLFKEACEVVIRHKQGSVSLLQRRLGIGYQRAARLIDKLEAAGIVSTFDGSKAREVMVGKDYIDSLFAKSGLIPTANREAN